MWKVTLVMAALIISFSVNCKTYSNEKIMYSTSSKYNVNAINIKPLLWDKLI